ncbi:hypothetical protein [Streptomyces sp. NPDC091259]|uniref:hypothetical protein n=1 Tax=Streptomyces sp. NPDC091259 TaxID=3365976 RepID=UPI0038121F91
MPIPDLSTIAEDRDENRQTTDTLPDAGTARPEQPATPRADQEAPPERTAGAMVRGVRRHRVRW